jgi:hypothetical protein
MDIPEIALLNSLRTMNEATKTWSDDRSHLHGFADGWKTCLETLLRVYGEPETIKQLKEAAEVCSVKAIPIADPDKQTQTLAVSFSGGGQ